MLLRYFSWKNDVPPCKCTHDRYNGGNIRCLDHSTSAKDVPQVQDIEYTGSGRFTWDVKPDGHQNDSTGIAEVVEGKDVFYINIWIGTHKRDRITFVVKDEAIKTYDLNSIDERYLSINLHDGFCSYASDNYYTGTLSIEHYDGKKQILGGSFQFIAYSNNCRELIRVVNGAFDVPITHDF